MKRITSKHNNYIKDLRKQKDDNKFLLFLDNPKVINEAVNKNIKINTLLIDEKKLSVFEHLVNKSSDVILVNEEIIKIFAEVKTPQGIVAIIELKQDKLHIPDGNFLVLDGLQDPGNVGTLIRSALGFGIRNLFLIDGVAVTNSKVIRSAMGTFFSVNIYQTSREEFAQFATKNNLRLVCADMNGEPSPLFDFANNCGLVLGNEGNGVSSKLKSICACTVTIPMDNALESFNVAVAGSVLMYEMKRRNYERS